MNDLSIDMSLQAVRFPDKYINILIHGKVTMDLLNITYVGGGDF